MALLEFNTRPSARELRLFAGLWWPLFCALLGLLLRFKWNLPSVALGVWCAGGALGLLGLFFPLALRPLFVGLLALTFPIGWVVSHLLLGLVYYLGFTVLGLWLRARGRDPLQLRKSAERQSYWEERPPARQADSYFSPF